MNVIGIDPGAHTGFALWDAAHLQLRRVESMSIAEAQQEIREAWWNQTLDLVIVEDARKRTFFRRMDILQAKYGAAVREGAGSAKREASIWEEFLKILGVPYVMLSPRRTKTKAPRFQLQTGWKGRTNEHARDAAMLVFGQNGPMVTGHLMEFEQRKLGGSHGSRGKRGRKASLSASLR